MKNIIRALRLPFISASILPFIFGSLIQRQDFNLPGFFLGLFAVVFTHLSANLINDYADSRSGVDWQDKRFFGFFGGSKLIQEKKLSEGFYLSAALLCCGVAIISIALLAWILESSLVIIIYALVVILSWQYSSRPLQFSYRMLGELFIFILFGPVTVMGGYFIQTGLFPDLRSFVLSLPFGFFTSAILFANEVPDFPEDSKSGKFTWVNLFGQKHAFVIYYLLMLMGFFSISVGISLRYLGVISVLACLLVFPATRAARILSRHYSNKTKLVQSSRITIAIQALAGLILIIDILL